MNSLKWFTACTFIRKTNTNSNRSEELAATRPRAVQGQPRPEEENSNLGTNEMNKFPNNLPKERVLRRT